MTSVSATTVRIYVIPIAQHTSKAVIPPTNFEGVSSPFINVVQLYRTAVKKISSEI